MTSTSTGNTRLTLIDIERPGNPGVFADSVRADAQAIIAKYPAGQSRSALLPMLHLVQSEQGYVTPDGIAFCAEVLDITKAQVAAVATFYTMYKRKPTGEYLVSVCTNTLCGLLGGDEIYKTLSELLGVGMNETTADGSITLEHAECLAACDYAPVVTVNYEFFDNQTTESAVGLVESLQGGTRPLPTRGAPLCSFKEISRQIAGFVDARPEARLAEATGAPTEAGVRLARERGEYPQGPDAEETPSSEPAAASSEPAAASSEPAAASAGSTAEAETAARENTGAAEESSANDEPLTTSESDPNAGDEPAKGPATQGDLFSNDEDD